LGLKTVLVGCLDLGLLKVKEEHKKAGRLHHLVSPGMMNQSPKLEV